MCRVSSYVMHCLVMFWVTYSNVTVVKIPNVAMNLWLHMHYRLEFT